MTIDLRTFSSRGTGLLALPLLPHPLGFGLLGQNAVSKHSMDILVLLGLLFGGALLLGFLGMVVYRIMLRRTREDHNGQAFTLNELRRLRDQGVLTPEEFERTKARLIAGLTDNSASPSLDTPPEQ